MLTHPMARSIERWLLDKLIPYARNPRTHSEAQIAQIAASTTEFGFNNPILVDSKAGIIAGHGRLLAARKLDLKEVHELDELLLDAAEDGEDVVPELPANPVTVPGDLWICGPHRLLCGDATRMRFRDYLERASRG